ARYSELFPRLARLDYHLLTFTDQRLLRGLEYKTWRATQGVSDRLALRAAMHRYRALLTTDPAQIALFPGPVVCDVDDPRYSPQATAAQRTRPTTSSTGSASGTRSTNASPRRSCG